MHGSASSALSSEDPIARALGRAAGLLPDQGPIGVFIHHNTLHALQHKPFHPAVQEGAALLTAEPYPTRYVFAQHVAAGRITVDDVTFAVAEHLQARAADVLPLGLRRDGLWRAVLLDPAEADALDDAIAPPGVDAAVYAELRARVRARAPALGSPALPLRHRDLLRMLGADDVDTVVHPELVRCANAYLDLGQARAPMPGRERGFLLAVAALAQTGARGPLRAPGAYAALRALATAGGSALTVIRGVLDRLAVATDAREQVLLQTALALPGFAGMFARLERQPHEHPLARVTTLSDFLAVRLVLEEHAVVAASAAAGLPTAHGALAARAQEGHAAPPPPVAHRLVAAVQPRNVPAVLALADDAFARLVDAVAELTPVLQRAVLLEAYEGHYRVQILGALAARRAVPSRSVESPTAQFIFCIDEREESIRRALEEQSAAHETFGVAGFFGVAIDYQGLTDHAPAAYCPVVVQPGHEVHEDVDAGQGDVHRAAAQWRSGVHRIERLVHRASRTLSGGALASLLFGPLAGALAFARVTAPRRSLHARAEIAARFAPSPNTRVNALRTTQEAAPGPRGKPLGFSIDEAADRVVALLQNIGLVQHFAPIVVVIGHGSTSLNNPHESAHDCGACGGRRGGANARVFADLVNRPEIRAAVAARGITIPDSTWFVGALHDTSDDSVQYFDLAHVPPQAQTAFAAADAALKTARSMNAQERCRRFHAAPLGVSPDAALAHVESRARHLAQPRPEYGHCTNAICVVGRRAMTRGLHLDRRAFLVSYDPARDPGASRLERILAAVGPVGAGISLEYYFSSVDNAVFGCGTKLPHNVTGLLGVMDGHQSDLRTGLPLQMVELHEPMRLLLIVEATPAALLHVASRQPEVRELVVNGWVQLVAVDPDTGAQHRFVNGGFVSCALNAAELPVRDTSVQWHASTRAHLPPALIRAGLSPV